MTRCFGRHLSRILALLVALYKTHDLATLERLYVVEGLSLKQVADDLGPPATKRTVQRALEAGGIRLRPARPPATKQLLMSRELLERLYVDEGRNLDEVAAIVGVNVATVKARMRRLDVKRRTGAWRRVGDREPMTHDLLYELRIVQRLPAVEIGRMLGYSEIQARSALARHGIAFRPRRPSLVQRLGAGELWWLHHHEQLTVGELARRLRTGSEAVAARLREVGLEVRQSQRRVTPPRRPKDVAEPDLKLIEQTFAAAAARLKRPRTDPRLLDLATVEELRRLHHDQGLGLTEIGERYGASSRSVRARFVALGVEVRHRRGRRGGGPLTPEALHRLGSLYQRHDVVDALRRLGIETRHDGEGFEPPVDLTAQVLSELYLNLILPLSDVALLTDRSTSAVSRALRHGRLESRRLLPQPEHRRGGNLGVPVDPNQVGELAATGLGAAEIAHALGIPSATTVRIVAQVMELRLAGDSGPPPVPATVARAVRKAGVDAGHAAAVLDPYHHGLGAGRHIPPWPWPPDPTLLRYLYGTLRLGAVEVADRLHVDFDQLKEMLRQARVPLRHEQDEQPATGRWQLDVSELKKLYIDEEWSITAIGAHLGVSNAVLYRAMHRHHLPIGPLGGHGAKRVRYDDLVADNRILGALKTAGVPLAGADPPIRRRPLPPPLQEALLVDLRLSTFDVELLTGRLGHHVRSDAAAQGIEVPLLPPGITVEDLRDVYLERGWSLARICQELGIPGRSSLLTMLDQSGIPKRAHKANPWDTRRPKRETPNHQP